MVANPNPVDTKALRRRGLVALAACCTTLLLAHLGIGAALPPLARLMHRLPWFRDEPLYFGAGEVVAPQLTVVGTSLSRSGLGPYTVASQLAHGLDLAPTQVANRSRESTYMADLLASLILAARSGSRSAVVELNPFLFNERKVTCAFRPVADDVVARDPTNALVALPQVKRTVQRAILHQLGLEGVLAEGAGRFAPARIRSSQIVGTLLAGMRHRLLEPDRDEVAENEQPSEKWRSKARDIVCRNFEVKRVEGIDLSVYDDLLIWIAARAREMSVVVFIPPLNRKLVAGCGGSALPRLEMVLDRFVEMAHQRGVAIEDLSHALDGREEVFFDYGHVLHPRDLALWTGMLAERLALRKLAGR
jgi:hypothetical protein